MHNFLIASPTVLIGDDIHEILCDDSSENIVTKVTTLAQASRFLAGAESVDLVIADFPMEQVAAAGLDDAARDHGARLLIITDGQGEDTQTRHRPHLTLAKPFTSAHIRGLLDLLRGRSRRE